MPVFTFPADSVVIVDEVNGDRRLPVGIVTDTDLLRLYMKTPIYLLRNIERVARRKLLQIHAATELASLRIPPGNQLEALKADRKGQHSIRINDQWRICFVWKTDGAHRVEIVDYH